MVHGSWFNCQVAEDAPLLVEVRVVIPVFLGCGVSVLGVCDSFLFDVCA